MNDKYLFLFTITPVQSFIAQARKTQDLYTGSWLLSELCRKAAQEAKRIANDEYKSNPRAEVIFPNIGNPSIPNRFILQITADEEPRNLGFEVKKKTNQFLLDFGKSILTEMNLAEPDNFKEQICGYFSMNWVVQPVNKGGYAAAYTQIERLLGAVKNSRQFSQLPETGRKCSLSGEQNALFYKPRKNDKGKEITPKFIDLNGNKPTKIKYNFNILSGEGLSAVSFIKRFTGKAKSDLRKSFSSGFPSTAEIAVMDAIAQIKENDDQVDLKQYQEFFTGHKNCVFDSQLYFEDNLKTKYFKKHDYDECVKDFSLITEYFDGKIKPIFEKYSLKLSKYYAILVFDGDDMGKWLSGAFLKEEKKDNLEAFHKTLTQKLGEYAAFANGSLSEPRGKAVYAGGDDFLGFVNLSHLFDVMTELRQMFEEKIDVSEFTDKKMTFSAGVAVAHYKTPLSEALKWARKMEKEAKQIDGKDAFAIAVLKHSGEIEKTVWRWKRACGCTPMLIKSIVTRLQTNEFSNTFIHNLHEELHRLLDEKGEIKFDTEGLDAKVLESEIKRLVGRSWMGKNKHGIDEASELKEYKKAEIANLSHELLFLYKLSKKLVRIDKPTSTDKAKNFLSALHIADFFSREVNYGH